MARHSITVFTFSYVGWGRDTKTMVEAVDNVEKDRGYDPPVFVDIRTSRSVRAVGMRAHKFEDLVGQDRYEWFRGLGNANARSTDAYPIRLIDPPATADLFDFVLARQEQNRRSIIFCGCPHPKEEGKIACHRYVVGTRLLQEARKRKKPLTVVEWPGGEPMEKTLDVPEEEKRRVAGGKKHLSVETRSPAELLALPWGSLLRIAGPEGSVYRLAGPAMHRQGNWWNVPILWHDGDEDPKPYRRRQDTVRKRLGVKPRHA